MDIQHLLAKEEFKKYEDEISSWIQSDEFKSLVSSNPYPPLLNPKQIDYTQIPAEIAWELNLPLPLYYHFIYLGSHGAGNSGFGVFLNRYGGHCIYNTNSNNSKKNYLSLYQQILKYIQSPIKAKFIYLGLRNYVCDEESKKFHSLIHSNKTINLIRDPISCLKHYLSLRMYYDKSIRTLTLDIKPETIVSKLVAYRTKVEGGGIRLSQNPIPTKEAIEYFIDFRYKCFHDTQLIDEILYKGELLYIDMQEIIGEKSFYTFQKLAKICNFPLQDEKNKKFFEKKVSEFEGFLPLTLHIYKLNMDIFITTPFLLVLNEYKLSYESSSRYESIKPDLNTEDVSDEFLTQAHHSIIIATDRNLLQKLKDKKELFEQTKKYLNDLIYHIEKQKAFEDERKLTEKDVLNFFKEDEKLYIKFDNVLNKHLSHLKKNCPDIIKSWKYYTLFKQLKTQFK